MAWGTPAERRKALESLAEKAEAKGVEHRAREASYRTQKKLDKAEKHAATAARQERIASGHRQELDRLAVRTREAALAVLSTAQRTAKMVKAQERASAAAAALPPVDPLTAYREALNAAVNLEGVASRDEKNARAYARAGDPRKAEISSRGATIARERSREWRAEAERVQSSTPRDLARELKLALKAERRLESQVKNEGKRRSDLGVVSDPLTAAGQREIASGGKGRGVKVASVSDYANLIRKPQERTQVRLDAMAQFDALCGTAESGLFPEPKFEHESGSGHGPGALVLAKRAAGLADMAAIQNALGARAVSMLRAWIYERHTLVALVRAGYGSERTMGATALAALDALVVFLKTQSPLDAVTAGMGLPARSRPAAGASEKAEFPRRLKCESGNANPKPARAGRTRPVEPAHWSNRLPAGDRPKRSTIGPVVPNSGAGPRTSPVRDVAPEQA